MSRVQYRLVSVLGLFALAGSPAFSADPPVESQIERLMETASQMPDRPDHDYVSNSLQALMRQSQELNLSKEQTNKIKTIMEQYDRTKHDRELAYKRSEMDALKLIHDRHSSMFSIENAVQKADQDHSKLRIAGIKALREARDVLRPEQYSRWHQDHAGPQTAQGMPREERGEQYDSEAGDNGRIAPH